MIGRDGWRRCRRDACGSPATKTGLCPRHSGRPTGRGASSAKTPNMVRREAGDRRKQRAA